jgi:hypothetical protein
VTVRIDTLRRQLAGTRTLLHDLELHLDDLHQLAYERHTTDRLPVTGGTRDYALDTHGDPTARDAYRDLGDTTATTLENLAVALHTAATVLKAGGNRGNQSRTHVTRSEHADLLAAQAERLAAGDTSSVRNEQLAQPGYAEALGDLQARLTAHEKINQRLVKRLRKLGVTDEDLLATVLNERRTRVQNLVDERAKRLGS